MRIFGKVFLVLVAALFLLPVTHQSSFGATKATLNIGWIPYGRDLGFFTALEKGYFKAAGLDVKIIRGYGGSKSAQDLGAGIADMAGCDTASLVLARGRGVPIKMAFMQHYIPPFVVRTLEGNGVNSLKDLEGKKFGTPAGDASWKNFPVLAKINGIDMSKINVINVAPSVRERGLLGGQYHAATGFITSTPVFRQMAKDAGKTEKLLLLKNFGLDMYGYGYAITDETATKRPHVARGLVTGTIKGVAYAMQHPDEGMDYLIKHAPTVKRVPNRKVWDIALDLWIVEESKTLGLGWMTDKMWKQTRDIIATNSGLKKTIPVKSLYTNDFLPKILPPKRAPRAIGRLF